MPWGPSCLRSFSDCPGPQEALLVPEGLGVTVLFLCGMAGPPWQLGDHSGSASPFPTMKL